MAIGQTASLECIFKSLQTHFNPPPSKPSQVKTYLNQVNSDVPFFHMVLASSTPVYVYSATGEQPGQAELRLCAAFTVECDHSHNRLYWRKPCGNSGNDTVSQTDGRPDFTVCLAWRQKSHYRPTKHRLLSSFLPLLSLGSITFFCGTNVESI